MPSSACACAPVSANSPGFMCIGISSGASAERASIQPRAAKFLSRPGLKVSPASSAVRVAPIGEPGKQSALLRRALRARFFEFFLPSGGEN